MNTAALKNWVQLLGVSLLMLAVCACDKKCQPVNQTPINSVTANPWRLISSTNPRITNLNRYTFLIMSFKSDFEGDIMKVVNNKQFDTPILTFKFNVETTGRSGRMRVVYSSVSAGNEGGEGGDGAQAPAAQAAAPVDYDYELRNRLTLTETKTGYTYEYLPFVGIVDPDSNCTF